MKVTAISLEVSKSLASAASARLWQGSFAASNGQTEGPLTSKRLRKSCG